MAASIEVILLSIICHYSRHHARDRYDIHRQMENFSEEEAQCWCCSVDHINPNTGAHVSCDREVVNAAITNWYDGGLDEFNQWVREDMHENFEKSLTGVKLFRYRDLLMIGITEVWLSLSVMAADCLDGDRWITEIVQALAQWIAKFPLSATLMIWLSACARRRLAGAFACLDHVIQYLVVIIFIFLNEMLHVIWKDLVVRGIWGNVLFVAGALPIIWILLHGTGVGRVAHSNVGYDEEDELARELTCSMISQSDDDELKHEA